MVAQWGDIMQTITKKQQEILNLLTEQFLTVKQICLALNKSHQYVYRTMKILAKKGLIFNDNGGVVAKGGVAQNLRSPISPPFETHKQVCNISINKGLTQRVYKSIRLHNQHFTIKILNKNFGYDRFRNRVSSFKLEGNTVRLNDSNVEVYSNQSFVGSTPEEVHKKSLEAWYVFFARLQSELKIVLLKDGFDNIKECRSHYAEVGNELAEDCNIRKEKVSIKGGDGREWLKIDNSFNLNELETVHPVLSKEDMSKVKYVFDDIRINDKFCLSDAKNLIFDSLKLQKQSCEDIKECVAGLSCVIKLIIPKEQSKESIIVDDGLNKKIPNYIN